MSTRPNPATMTVTQTATVLGISRSSAYECVRRGVIPSLRLGRRIVGLTTAIEAQRCDQRSHDGRLAGCASRCPS